MRQQADDLWEKTKGGMTATNGFGESERFTSRDVDSDCLDVGFKIRPSQSDVQEMGPVYAINLAGLYPTDDGH